MSLLLLLFLLVGAVTISSFFHKKFGFSILFYFLLLIVFLYSFSFLLPLNFSFYLFIVITLGSFLYVLLKKKICKKNIFTLSFYLFIIFYFFFYLLNINKGFSNVDEFTHWGDVVYAMLYGNRLSAFNTLDCWYSSYPPAISIVQYFFVKFLGYKEGILYFGYQLVFISLILPFLDKIKIKKIIIIFLIILIFPLTFYKDFYTSIYVDALLGVFFGFLISYITLYKNLDKFDISLLCLGFISLTLLKDAGIFFSFVAWIYLWFILLKNRNGNKFLILCITLFAILFFRFSWSLLLYFNDVLISHESTFSFNVLLTFLHDSEKLAIMKRFADVFYHDFVLIIPFKLTYISIVMIFILSLYFIYRYDRKYVKPFGFFIVCSFLYMIGLLFVFQYNFDSSDVDAFASYGRYSCIYLNGILTFIVTSVLYRFHDKNIIFVLLIILVFFNSTYLTNIFTKDSDLESRRFREVIQSINLDDKLVVFSSNFQRDVYAKFHYLTRPIELSTDCERSCITENIKVIKNKKYDYLYIDNEKNIVIDGITLKRQHFYKVKNGKLILLKTK